MISKIVSGGQTGADRAALDWAIRRGALDDENLNPLWDSLDGG
jgi:hypothetical protein